MPSAHILVVDDEARIRETLSSLLEDEGYQVSLAGSGEEALQIVEQQVPDLVILDIWMPGIDGIATLNRLKTLLPDLMVTMISGHGTIELAVKATQLGAYDFFEKPLNVDKLLISIERALERLLLSQRYEDLRHQVEERYRIIGECPETKHLLQLIHTAAPTNARVLISGENGTGKELVARAIHRLSKRASGPFVEVNCAAIPEELIESEMFGHEKGAFTGATKMKKGKFEMASGGTIFLDEIGDMSLKTQAKVLRVLEEQTIERVGGDRMIKTDVRVIAASNKSLPELIQRNEFREDLYFRLNVIEIHVPSLAERRADIPLLCEHFLQSFARENNMKPQRLSAETVSLLMDYPWPGNIRELRNVIEALGILCRDSEIPPHFLPLRIRTVSPPEAAPAAFKEFSSLKEAKEDFERSYIVEMLKRHHYNVTRTAEALKIERTNLHRKLKALDLDVGELQEPEG